MVARTLDWPPPKQNPVTQTLPFESAFVFSHCAELTKSCDQLGLVDLGEQHAAFIVVARITAGCRQCIRCKRNKVLEREPPRNVFGMRIQSSIFVDDEYGRQLGGLSSVRVAWLNGRTK